MTLPLDLAYEYLEKEEDWSLVPVPFREKAPTITNWPKLRITNTTAPHYFNGGPQNIGVILGEASGDLVDVDLDCPEAAALAPFFLPPTPARFGRAGKPNSHWLYTAPNSKVRAFSLGKEDGGMQVEVRGTGGQTILPGSTHHTGEAIEWASKGEPPREEYDALVQGCAHIGAATVLVRKWVEGVRNEAALPLAGMLLGAGWAVPTVENFVRAVATEARDEEVESRVRAVAATEAKRTAGENVTGLPRLAEALGLSAVEQKRLREWLGLKTETPNFIDEYNQLYAFVIAGSSAVILVEGMGGEPFSLLKLSTFLKWKAADVYRPPAVEGEDEDDKKPIRKADAWLKHKNRRTYEKIGFWPGQNAAPPNCYNLWKGWPVAPDRTGNCELFLEHLLKNICGGDTALFQWLLGWFADIFQNPRAKKGSSVAICGRQGTGKTLAGQTVGRLLGDAYLLVDTPRHVVGTFNSQHEGKLLLHADEALFAGDPRATGHLKGMVTGTTTLIERKGIDAVVMDNHMRLLITSNSEHVVPAEERERRFAVLECGEGWMQQHEKFAAMVAQLENEHGYGKLMHELMTFDLATVNLRQIPATAALDEQKVSGFDPAERFWHDRLYEGKVLSWREEQIDEDGETWESAWPEHVRATQLYDDYLKSAGHAGARHKLANNKFGAQLRKMCPSVGKGKRPFEITSDFGTTRAIRAQAYILPDLGNARAEFDKWQGMANEWPEEDAP
jgi:hypothetical protein